MCINFFTKNFRFCFSLREKKLVIGSIQLYRLIKIKTFALKKLTIEATTSQ